MSSKQKQTFCLPYPGWVRRSVSTRPIAARRSTSGPSASITMKTWPTTMASPGTVSPARGPKPHTVLCFSFEVPLLASMAAWAAARRAIGTRKGEQLT